jgi:L-lactate oxidase
LVLSFKKEQTFPCLIERTPLRDHAPKKREDMMEANRRQFLTAAGAATGAMLAPNVVLAQAASGPASPAMTATASPPMATQALASGAMPDLPTVTAPGYDAPSAVRKPVFRNLRTIQDDARQVIPSGGFGYISSGAGDEWTLHENMNAFKRVQILPRYLSGNGVPDTRITLLGTEISLPVVTTVFGGHAIAHVTAEAGTAYGTHQAGTIFTCGSQANLPMEVVAKASPGPMWMQLYMQDDPGLMREFLQRAKASNYKMIVVTMDAFFPSNRETDIANHYSSPFQAANFPKQEATGYFASSHKMKQTLSWTDIAFVQKESGLPVSVKGVLTPEMATQAVRNGCAAIQVSNHGGRQLDDTPATITVLPSIVQAVDGRIPIIFDSGVRRGQDVFKALAMGATAVAMGRPILYGLSLGGWMGVDAVYEKLRAELVMTMMAAGTAKVADIGRTSLMT